MKLKTLFTIGTVILSIAAGTAFAQNDKAKKQAEIRKVAQVSLENFYKAGPNIKGEVEKSPGYAVFTTYGLSFLVGGAGGKGIARDNKTKKETFMHMAQASVGAQAGIAESETLIIFSTQKALDNFIAKGWDASGGGSLQGGAAGTSVGGSAAQGIGEKSYTLTKNGLAVGMMVAGTKYSKDKDLN